MDLELRLLGAGEGDDGREVDGHVDLGRRRAWRSWRSHFNVVWVSVVALRWSKNYLNYLHYLPFPRLLLFYYFKRLFLKVAHNWWHGFYVPQWRKPGGGGAEVQPVVLFLFLFFILSDDDPGGDDHKTCWCVRHFLCTASWSCGVSSAPPKG